MSIDFGSYRLIQLLGHRSYGINAVAFSPDGSYVASGAADSLIRIWNARIGELLRTLEGHEGEVTTLAISPDGQWLASGAGDRTVHLWEAASGKPLRTLEGHKAGVTSLAISPDSKWLASSGADRTVRLWNAATGVLLEIHRRYPCKLQDMGLAFVIAGTAEMPFAGGTIWLRTLANSILPSRRVNAPAVCPFWTRPRSSRQTRSFHASSRLLWLWLMKTRGGAWGAAPSFMGASESCGAGGPRAEGISLHGLFPVRRVGGCRAQDLTPPRSAQRNQR